MPYVALNADDDHWAMVMNADPLANFCCPECLEPVSYVCEHTREDTDDTVNAHFRYYNCSHLGITPDSSNKRSSGGGGGGEDPLHRQRKWTALQVALDRYEAASHSLEKYIGSKRADAVLEFDEPHDEYGRGLVIEYQHKNESKDIIATERHYARHEYTTLWLWEEQFRSLSGVPDVDLFGGRVCTPFPYAVPPVDEWSGTQVAELTLQGLVGALPATQQTKVPATIVRDWVVPTPREYWVSEGWDAGFDITTGSYGHQGHWKKHSSVPATFPKDWFAPTPREYWKSKEWSAAFRNHDGYKHEFATIQALAGSLPVTSSQPAVKLPPAVIEEVMYESDCWVREKQESESKHRKLVFSPTLPFAVVDAWLSDRQKPDSIRVEPPPTRFDDVQCYSCGSYQYAPDAGVSCPTCGKLYDWEWNLETDRVGRENLPSRTESPASPH